MATDTFKRAFIWEMPVRVYHWINAIAVFVLCITGFLIANPPAIMSGFEANDQYWFGWIRFIHFAFAYLFIFNFIYRIYWAFVGNKYASWKQFLPFTPKGLREIWHVIRVDILLMHPVTDKLSNIAVGHNALAALSYLILFFLSLVQIFTGFGLYADLGVWWFSGLFSWVNPLLGGDAISRLIHHLVMWGFIVFSIIHIYLVFYHDWIEGRGETSSMVSGYKFVREERLVYPEELEGKLKEKLKGEVKEEEEIASSE